MQTEYVYLNFVVHMVAKIKTYSLIRVTPFAPLVGYQLRNPTKSILSIMGSLCETLHPGPEILFLS